MLSKKDIDNLAQLSRLDLSLEEKTRMEKEVDSILDYVGELRSVVSAKSLKDKVKNAGNPRNVMREDIPLRSRLSDREDLLSAAPDREDGFVKVKKIL